MIKSRMRKSAPKWNAQCRICTYADHLTTNSPTFILAGRLTLTFSNIEAPSLRFPADSMKRFLDKNSAGRPYICLPFLSLSLSLCLSPGSDGRSAGGGGFDVSKPGHLFPTTDDRGRQGKKRARLVEQKSEGASGDPR